MDGYRQLSQIPLLFVPRKQRQGNEVGVLYLNTGEAWDQDPQIAFSSVIFTISTCLQTDLVFVR